MLSRISFLVLLGCFLPSVFGRPSVSLQNDGNGNYKFEYDVSHPKGSSRGHMKFGEASKQQGGDYPSHSQLSPAPQSDSYRAEKDTRRPQHYVVPDSENLHDPQPIYPSPYDSSEKHKPGSLYDQSSYQSSAPEPNYHPQTSYQSSAPKADYHPQTSYQSSAPEANYHPQTSYQSSAPKADYHPQTSYQSPEANYHPQTSYQSSAPEADYHPQTSYQSSAPEVDYHPPQPIVKSAPVTGGYSGIKTAQPISQVSVPAFSEPQGSYEDVKPVPVGPNYQFIPDGPPYVVNSHSTEIIHPSLPSDPVVQKPVELAAPVVAQQTVGLAPPVGSQQVLTQEPVVIQEPVELSPLPKQPVLLQEPVELSPPVQQIVHEPQPYTLPEVGAHPAVPKPALSLAFQLPIQKPVVSSPKVEDVQQSHNDDFVPNHSDPVLVNEPVDLPHQPLDEVHSPVSHSLRLPVLSPSPEITSGPSAAAIEAVPELAGHISGNSHPLSHSTRLILPGPSAPHHPDNSISSLSDIDSPVNSHVVPPVSHAFRLSLPSAPELKSVEESSPFTEVETPEVPQLPQLSHAFRLSLPSSSYGSRISNNPNANLFASEDLDASLDALNSKL